MDARCLAVVICCLGGVAAGCGRGAPTGMDERAGVNVTPFLDGGVMHGSGNRGTDGTSTQQSADATAGNGFTLGGG